MSTFQTVKSQLQTLVDNANAVTGKNDANVTDAQASLIDGYAVLQEKTVTQNGVVTPDFNFNGLSKVTVNVPDRVVKLQDKTITENGTYTADSGYDGLGSVTVEVESGLEGLENGYDVMFYDENGDGLAFYSIKNGHTIPAPPVYSCKFWETESGDTISFPITPTEDMVIFANNESLDKTLYEFYKVDRALYPYVVVNISTYSSGKDQIGIRFGKEIVSNTTSVIRFSEVLYGRKNGLASEIASLDLTDMGAVITFLKQKVYSVSSSSITNVDQNSSHCVYSNFEHNLTPLEVSLIL